MSNPPPPPLADVPPPANGGEEPIEGRGFQPPSNPDPKLERESKTARTIAITLLWMLGVTFVANLVTMIVLTIYNRTDAAPQFERMFAVWMPLLSGLVGSAITFYLTKERK
jgi:hypothetical protein